MVCDDDIASLRAFNRTYTRRLRLIDAYLDQRAFTLSEARILYEIANRHEPTAAVIGRALDLDRAQVSRTLRRFGERRIVDTRADPSHRRNQLLSLTAEGRVVYDALEAAAEDFNGALLDALPLTRRRRLLSAADTIRKVLEASDAPIMTLRAPRSGDLGLLIHSQAVFYADAYGYDQSYEALISRILADYHERFDPDRDAGWIADIDEQIVGSVFLMHTEVREVGRLRMLYVAPEARGAGVGKRLVTACIDRAREAGYSRLELWTDAVLVDARRLYEHAGFSLSGEAPEEFFGTASVGQTWSLTL